LSNSWPSIILGERGGCDKLSLDKKKKKIAQGEATEGKVAKWGGDQRTFG